MTFMGSFLFRREYFGGSGVAEDRAYGAEAYQTIVTGPSKAGTIHFLRECAGSAELCRASHTLVRSSRMEVMKNCQLSILAESVLSA